MTFPSQKQESFFFGHVRAFQHFGGVPARISYDNLATAVKLALDKKRKRTEQRTFTAFRSHYLFESHFCTPGQGHEKGQVEHGVGFARRNFMVPVPEVASFEDLNQHLLEQCRKDDGRQVHRQTNTIGQSWEFERPFLRPLPPFEFDCCEMTMVRLTPYSQVTFDTNRYSVPIQRARRDVTLKAYPFHIDILDKTTLLARHPRCYARDQDIFDPLHYLPLLEQRPGAFDYAKPLRRWREGWPDSYRRMLAVLREKWPEGRGVQEFVRILMLHETYPSTLMQEAIEQALSYGCVHLDGVLHCLHQLTASEASTAPLDLTDHPQLDAIGNQPVDLSRYEQLLKLSWVAGEKVCNIKPCWRTTYGSFGSLRLLRTISPLLKMLHELICRTNAIYWRCARQRCPNEKPIGLSVPLLKRNFRSRKNSPHLILVRFPIYPKREY